MESTGAPPLKPRTIQPQTSDTRDQSFASPHENIIAHLRMYTTSRLSRKRCAASALYSGAPRCADTAGPVPSGCCRGYTTTAGRPSSCPVRSPVRQRAGHDSVSCRADSKHAGLPGGAGAGRRTTRAEPVSAGVRQSAARHIRPLTVSHSHLRSSPGETADTAARTARSAPP